MHTGGMSDGGVAAYDEGGSNLMRVSGEVGPGYLCLRSRGRPLRPGTGGLEKTSSFR